MYNRVTDVAIITVIRITIFFTTATFSRWLVVGTGKSYGNKCGSSPSSKPRQRRSRLDTLRLVSVAWHMVIYYEVTRHGCVHAVIFPAPFRMSFRNAHYMKTIVILVISKTRFATSSEKVCLSPFLSVPVRAVITFLFPWSPSGPFVRDLLV
jgi:hypothetical protein